MAVGVTARGPGPAAVKERKHGVRCGLRSQPYTCYPLSAQSPEKRLSHPPRLPDPGFPAQNGEEETGAVVSDALGHKRDLHRAAKQGTDPSPMAFQVEAKKEPA